MSYDLPFYVINPTFLRSELGKNCPKCLVCRGEAFWHLVCPYRSREWNERQPDAKRKRGSAKPEERAQQVTKMSGQAMTLEDLVMRFQSASESLERSYRELQGRVQSLTAELEREREERIRLERLAAMGEMAMEMAHEIRNPLGSIELYASMLEGDYAEQIVRSVRLLNHSVTNILQFGKPIMPMPEWMPVRQLLEGIRVFLQPIAEQKRIRIVTDCDQDCSAVADHELLHRMLLNLVLNAIRETPTDGTVRLSGQVAGGDVLIAVEDTGPGIQEERLVRIFDPMFSTSREGCGLGLPIVKRIVESHKGTIEVSSSRSGTKFLISLPQNMEVLSEPVASC